MESTLSSGSDIPTDCLKLQILAYDSYQSNPSVLDKNYSTISLPHNDEVSASNKPFLQVPVIRIFGKLPTGHTVLLNIHNCFPYIFIEYDGDLEKDKAKQHLKDLKLEIEKQLYLSFKKVKLRKSKNEGENEDEDIPDIYNDYSKDDNHPTNYENKYISSMLLVKSIPFYGYHVGLTAYVKISLLNPRYLSRLSSILLLGKVRNKVFQPFESHIPYLLQFLADYNLYGCDWIYLKNLLWRSPIICNNLIGEFEEHEFEYTDDEINLFNEIKLNQELKDFLEKNVKDFKEESMTGEVRHGLNVTSEEQFPRIGTTVLEIDCLPQWILNISSLSTRDLHHDFIEISKLATSRDSGKYLSSTLDILKDILHQRAIRSLDHESFFSKLSLMTDSDIRDHSGETKWIEQEELNDMLRHCIDLSNEQYLKQTAPDFETFVQNSPLFEYIQTPKENIQSGMFRNIQWNKLSLATNADVTGLRKDSITSTEIATPLDMRVLPSSMFDDEPLRLLDDEGEQEDNEVQDSNWMGTIPPHRSQDEVDSISSDSQLDRLEDDLFSKLKVVDSKSSDHANELEGYSLIHTDHMIFSQVSKRGPSLVIPLSGQISSEGDKIHTTLKDSQNAFFEFKKGLPKNDDQFMNSFEELGLLKKEYADPFYSKIEDIPNQPFVFAGNRFIIGSDHYSLLPKVLINGISPSAGLMMKSKEISKSRGGVFEYQFQLPSFKQVNDWLLQEPASITRSQLLKSQILHKTPTLKHGFKYPSLLNGYKRRKSKFNKLITLAVEIHVNTRNDLKPDPKLDEITAIFWSFDKESYPFDLNISDSGILLLDSELEAQVAQNKYLNLSKTPIAIFDNEITMVRELVSIVKLVDPDLMTGFEIHSRSWGYIIERFRDAYDIDLCSKFSRVVFKGNNKFGDRWGYTHASGIKITGRHMMNLWRILRLDVNLLKYTLENISFHVLHRRIPHYSEKQLTEWFKGGDPSSISAVLHYYMSRTKLNLEILERQEIISKTTEQAKLIGVDFYSIFYRGSQFKVESFLIRLTKSENFMLISPSKQQVFKADALQCIPLIMEPTSAFYKSPLVVLDFQSLYPSIIIAYNYCYSTLLGRLRGYNAKYPQTIGITKNKLKPGLLELLKDYITISPNGLMFVNSKVRKSTLAKMLTEILETRILVKETMKDLRDDYELNKLYNSRQLALKLLANVTYGYTSATFSGRMPCADIADAIVSTGRETLNLSIKLIEENPVWGAKVVYGDTDSLFVYFPGKTREEAFRYGKEAALYVTSLNPKPMKLKFEKVYHPCVLLSKKRYVGYSYVTEDQKDPTFDAKGIETVRRDGIPAQQKIVEKSLRILFETADLSQVKEYVQDQFTKIMNNKVSVQDFCFAKEVRIGTYKDERYAPAGAHLAKNLMELDKRAEPQYKERVPYVVLQSYKGERLKDRCVTPQFFLDNEIKEGLRLDWEYYITKALIPPLERIFNLVGVDVKAWYREMPRVLKYGNNFEEQPNLKKRKLNVLQFLKNSSCLCCSERTYSNKRLCANCLKNELLTILKLTQKISNVENEFRNLLMICRSCSSTSSLISNSMETAQKCTSDDCPIFYSRIKNSKKFDSVMSKEAVLLEELREW